jgi:hypothetical protein
MTKALLAVLATFPLTACVADSEDQYSVDTSALSESAQADFSAARSASAEYHSLATAQADGYVDTGLPCIDGQGYHWIKPSLLGTYSATEPHILMYFPRGDHMQLVALEWIQPIADETTTAATMFGHEFHGPNTVPGVPFSFYGLHVWAWLNNGAGMFEDANDKLVCP